MIYDNFLQPKGAARAGRRIEVKYTKQKFDFGW